MPWQEVGLRWKGPHEQAADFVAKAGDEGKEIARELRRLLPLKTQAHYEPGPVSATKARGAVAAAERAVAIRATHRRSGPLNERPLPGGRCR